MGSFLFESIDVLDEGGVARRGAWVGVSGGTIDYVGDRPPCHAYDRTYDGRGKLLMPALCNAHSHAPMTLLRGYAEGLPLSSWLNDRVFPFEARIDDASARAATDLAIAEMVRFGCVSFSDMYYFDEARCESVLDAGVKCNLSRAMTAFGDQGYRGSDCEAANRRLLSEWDGAGSGRLRVDLSIHAEYTSNERACRELIDHARSSGAALHIHVSETRDEVEGCRSRHGGLSPVGYLDSLGAFDGRAVAAHCVWVDADDIDVLADRGVTVACNPASNLKLASGFAPVPAMLARGVSVALGSDGPASNNAHDLFRDMYLFSILYKGSTADPTAVSPAEALNAATRAGFLGQGRTDSGLVRPGFRADLAVLDVDAPWMAPATDLAANVVYAANGSEVVLTMCDGAVVYEDGAWPTIDVERAAASTAAHARSIIDALGR